jgi:hypothetical protein
VYFGALTNVMAKVLRERAAPIKAVTTISGRTTVETRREESCSLEILLTGVVTVDEISV